MQASQKAFDLIKKWEGFREEAYKDGGGKLTIGYGHTEGVKEGDRVTHPMALLILADDVRKAEKAVNAALGTTQVSQDRFDVLVSFTFNLGEERMRTSTFLKRIKSGDMVGAVHELGRWVYDKEASPYPIPGLINRRTDEIALFSGQPVKDSALA